jgi:thioredoxin-like negative regulator of GroEL
VAKILSADTLRSRRDLPASLRTLQEALRIADAWMVHFELARAYVASGDVDQARTELEECMRRRGEGALAYTAYEVPTLRHVREASDLLARLPVAGR